MKNKEQQTWWQHHLDMKEDYADLAWAIYNFEFMLDETEDVEEHDDQMSEQVWAIRNGIGMNVEF